MSNTFSFNTPFLLESGDQLFDLDVHYHTFGSLNAEKSNVIWVFHSISTNSDVLDWWNGLFGNDRLYDPTKYFIICVNTLGSPYGAYQPKDLSAPVFTIRDIVQVQIALAKELKITHIHTLIGGSFGGYQALEFAYAYEGKVDHLILLACSAKESAWGIAIHESQRIALRSDPSFGQHGKGKAGMKAARSMAMLTYRTNDVFIAEQSDSEEKYDNFRASSYMQYTGDKFIEKFDAICYYYLTKCIDTHNIGRGRGGISKSLSKIRIPTLVIGFDTDQLVPTRFQKELKNNIPNARYVELHSDYGHDGFIKECDQITGCIQRFYKQSLQVQPSDRKVLKFGGSSLKGTTHLNQFLSIVKKEYAISPLVLVVSARGKTTDMLIELYDLACSKNDFTKALEEFKDYQNSDFSFELDWSDLFIELKDTLKAIQLLGVRNKEVHDLILSFGERISIRFISQFLNTSDLESIPVDSRSILFTKKDSEVIDEGLSASKTSEFISSLSSTTIPVISGFIASNPKGQTVTLGRNGSNYSATLIGRYIRALEIQNWTDVTGIYSANPAVVKNAVRIDTLSYREANELANFGANILHPKTILPLVDVEIPLRIRSIKSPNSPGTLIDKTGGRRGIKAVTNIQNVALISIEGKELAEKVGIDARIFSALQLNNISVKMIAQASTERGIGFVIQSHDVPQAISALNHEFSYELQHDIISNIRTNQEVAIVAILGRHNFALEKAIKILRRNRIWMHLISNSISGEHISLVIDNKQLDKAQRLIHNEVFGTIKTLHVFSFGKGLVGSTLIEQILSSNEKVIQERNLEIKVIGVADTTHYIINTEGLDAHWKKDLKQANTYSHTSEIINALSHSGLENIVIADNTSSELIAGEYMSFLKHNFDIVASNKKVNSGGLEYCRKVKAYAAKRGRSFYYETNVGAGLPIIDTIKHLYQSSDRVTKIRGVFSGSLSYLFNTFSAVQAPFSEQLLKARELGYTEPDPRDDLSGMDVARKLVILAREINYPARLEAVQVENLIPECCRNRGSYEDFKQTFDELDEHYSDIKNALKQDHVLRYIAELDVKSDSMKVTLEQVEKNSPLGQLKNADTIFEIYTETYGENPMIIQGAGAGGKVTARGVYSDLLRVGLLV